MTTFFRNKGTTTPVRVQQIGPSYPGRPQYTGNWQPGMITNTVQRWSYDAMRHSPWNAVNVLPNGRWTRGNVLRFNPPPIAPPLLGFFAYDPTAIVQGD